MPGLGGRGSVSGPMHTSPCPASLCMYRLSDISVCAYRLSDICGLGAFPQRAQRWSWVSFGVVWVGGLVYVPWCGGLVGGLSIGLWVHVTMEEDCPGAPKTISSWVPESSKSVENVNQVIPIINSCPSLKYLDLRNNNLPESNINQLKEVCQYHKPLPIKLVTE